MTTPDRLRTTLALGALAVALTLAGCSSSDQGADESPSGSSADRGIDASHYAESYGQDGSADAAGPHGDDTFVDHGTSGYVDPQEDPESTFALDVDTGSFSVAKSLLAQGVRPPAASIRAEEWVNSFDYGDEAPDDDALAVHAETGLDPDAADGGQLVRVAVTSRELSEYDRPRAHVTLVVDRSGSMDMDERLGLVKSSLAVLANELRGDDTVAVVSFDDVATPILEPTPVRDTEAVLAAVDRLQPGGSTNLEDGLRLGYEQARASYEDDAVNVVVLCSDGVANVGDTMPDSIVDTIAEEGAAGIHLVTVGFGMGNYNDHLMEQLADQGDGFYSYVDTYDEAERLFGTELTTTLLPVAAEARAQVRFDSDRVSSYRLVGYEDRAMDDQDFEDLAVDAGELGPGHHATALYEVELADGVAPGEEIGIAELRWVDPDDGEGHRAATEVRSASERSPGAGFELASLVADTALHLKNADYGEGYGEDYGEDYGEGYGEEPWSDLGDLERRAAVLAEAEVAGAEELLAVIRQAELAEG